MEGIQFAGQPRTVTAPAFGSQDGAIPEIGSDIVLCLSVLLERTVFNLDDAVMVSTGTADGAQRQSAQGKSFQERIHYVVSKSFHPTKYRMMQNY